MKKIIYLFMVILVINCAYSYPNIIYDKGVNVTKAKKAVYSLNEKYYEKVDQIYFTTKDACFFNHKCIITIKEDVFFRNFIEGQTFFYVDYWTDKYVFSRINIYYSDEKDFSRMRDVLKHELNHHYLRLINDSRWENERWCTHWELKD